MNALLLPFSWLYGLGVSFRNTLFDLGVLESRSYDIPVICIGNLTIGGTGKTPHTEYLIRLLCKQYKVAVLSRGYKRKSKGYVLADAHTPMEQIGDEPWQIKQKFPDVYVAVDGNRRRGIKHLCNDEATRDVDVILLDDAYQHRYVKPGVNILLVDHNRPIHEDHLLPMGRLREPFYGKNRADMVIITKCPADIKPMGFRVLSDTLSLRPYQKLFFSTMDYGDMYCVFHPERDRRPLNSLLPEEHILMLTGIAQPQPMLDELHRYSCNITTLTYRDHHDFTATDIQQINERFKALPSPRLVITTEKDASRLLASAGLNEQLKEALYALPIEPKFLRESQESFNNKILSYVHKNSRHSILAKK